MHNFKLIALLLNLGTIFCSLEQAKKKYEYLLAESLSDEFGVVKLDEKYFPQYVSEIPRDYDLLIFLTAFNCNYCDSIEAPFTKVAHAYKLAN